MKMWFSCKNAPSRNMSLFAKMESSIGLFWALFKEKVTLWAQGSFYTPLHTSEHRVLFFSDLNRFGSHKNYWVGVGAFQVLLVVPGTVLRENYRVWNLNIENYCAAFFSQTVVRPTTKNLYSLAPASLQDDGSMHKANSLKLDIIY